MKMILFLLFLTPQVFASNQNGNNPILRFIAEIRVLREIALYTVIEDRCYRYLKSYDRDSCSEAVDHKVSLLDFDILLGKDQKTPVLLDKHNPSSFVFVAFKKDFLRLLSEQKTEHYLERVNEEMSKYLTGEKSTLPNLWDISVSFYGSDYEAARALAVLFQDTSHVKLHLAFLEMSGVQGTTSWFNSNRELLGRTIDTLNMVLDYRGEDLNELFYPKAIQGRLQRTIYHFYVPTYLAMALRKRGVPERFAFIAPFMMSLTYEFVTSAQDFRYLFEDPKNVSDWSLGDLYGSYNGVSFGLGRLNRVLPLPEVRKAFNVSTKIGVETLLK